MRLCQKNLNLQAMRRSLGWLHILAQKPGRFQSMRQCQGPDRWFMEIDGSVLYLHFEIGSPQIIGEILGFLERRGEHSKESGQSLEIGKFNGSPVLLLRSDENADQVTICFGNQGAATLRYLLQKDDLADFVESMRQLKDEI